MLELRITPNYYRGATFEWTPPVTSNAPAPWIFQVMQSDDGQQNWIPLSDLLVDQFAFVDQRRAKLNRDDGPYYKVVMYSGATPYGESPVRAAQEDLPRTDYLIAREIMFREGRGMRKKAGVLTKVWKRAETGRPCQRCADPVTHVCTDSECPSCLGTGVVTPYHGPYPAWAVFTPANSDKNAADGGAAGMSDIGYFKVRALATPPMSRNDVIEHPATGARMRVHTISNTTEIRRVPILQDMEVTEEQAGSVLGKLGEDPAPDSPVAPGEGKCYNVDLPT